MRVRLFCAKPEDELENSGDEDGNGGGKLVMVPRTKRKRGRRGDRQTREVGRSLLKIGRLAGGVQLIRGGSRCGKGNICMLTWININRIW